MKPKNGDVRRDGRRFDGTTWRKTGTNHHMNADGLIFYKRKYRTLDGYLQQGGNMEKIVFSGIKAQQYNELIKRLYDKEETGDVYLIINPAWPEWIKVGKALDAQNRCHGYQTSSPFRDYEVIATLHSDNRSKKEKEMHKVFEHFAKERRGEWFKIDKIKAINIFNIHATNELSKEIEYERNSI
jgi:hypothetical protein